MCKVDRTLVVALQIDIRNESTSIRRENQDIILINFRCFICIYRIISQLRILQNSFLFQKIFHYRNILTEVFSNFLRRETRKTKTKTLTIIIK